MTKPKPTAISVARRILLSGKPLSQLRFLELTGSWRLSSYIHTLKKEMKIGSLRKEVKTRYGAKTTVSIYRMIKA